MTYEIARFKWETNSPNEDGQQWSAATPFGSYTIIHRSVSYLEEYGGHKWQWSYCFDEYYDEGTFEANSLKECKSAAWKHWTERLSGALREAKTTHQVSKEGE